MEPVLPPDLLPGEICVTFKGTAQLIKTEEEDASCPVPPKR